jgi:uroporphyrinogen-III decarboxylase
VKELGAYYLYHNCGDAASLLDQYSKIHMDIYESLTQPPYGDTVLEEALAKIDRSITLCGNIDQIEFLKKATPAEVSDKVKRVLELAKKRGNFILGTTDYFSEGTPHENIKAMAEAALEYGVYKSM